MAIEGILVTRATPARRILPVASIEVRRRVKSRAEYRRWLRWNRTLFGLAAALAVLNAALPMSRLTVVDVALSLAMLVMAAFSLAATLPCWKRSLDEWDRLTATRAFCGERSRASFESVIAAYPDPANPDCLTGQTISVPVCLECGER